MACLGIDLGGTNTKLVRLEDGRDEPALRTEIATPRSVEESAGVLEGAVEQLLRGGSALEAIGISVAGLVDDHRQVVQAPNLPFYEGVDVSAPLRERHPNVPVAVENDVNCAIVAEHQVGAGRGLSSLCMLSLGTGVGGGVIVDGHLVRGSGGLAGELGHMVIQPDGPLCTCGLPGHVESFLSAQAIAERGRRALEAEPERGRILAQTVERSGGLDPRALADAARAGCPVATDVLRETGRWLGIACVNLAHALQPDCIVIGGGVSRAGELLLDPAKEEFARSSMRAIRGSVPIVRAELGVDGAAIGAAVLARRILDGR